MRRRAVLFFVMLPLIASLGACVEKVEFDQFRNQVNQSLFHQRQQLRELDQRLATMEEKMAALEKERQQQRKSLADHLNDFILLQQELAAIRGRVETLEHRGSVQWEKSLNELKGRVERLEAGLGVKPPRPEAAAAAPPPQPVKPPPPPRPSKPPVDELYKEARFSFEEGNYPQAREKFAKLLKEYPNSSFAPSAQFWIGECYFREGNLKQAILEYEKVISKYPDSPKVPSSMLKQGMAFEKLGDSESARYLYNKIIKEFPDSDQATLARHRLKKIK